MIAHIFAGSLAAALFLLSFALLRVRLESLRNRLRRQVKVVTVAWRQMRDGDRQTYVMGAGIVVFFVWWSVAIVKGW